MSAIGGEVKQQEVALYIICPASDLVTPWPFFAFPLTHKFTWDDSFDKPSSYLCTLGPSLTPSQNPSHSCSSSHRLVHMGACGSGARFIAVYWNKQAREDGPERSAVGERGVSNGGCWG
jgi:hypothetical protein